MSFTQLLNLPLPSPEHISGRTYIVTGAGAGLGRYAAQHLVTMGAAKVIMAVRNVAAAEKVREDIDTETKTSGVAEVWYLDLASYDSVKAFAKKASDELDRLDCLIQNAGVGMPKDHLSEGHLTSNTVNVYSTYLLAFLLFPKLSESAKRYGIVPRSVIVTSCMCFSTQEQWNLVKDDENPITKVATEDAIDNVTAYSLSKGFGMQAFRHIAPQIPLSKTGVIFNLVCPGLCKTDITRAAPEEYRKNVTALMDQVGRTAEDGSRTLLFGATAGKESDGKLTADCEIKEEAYTPSWIGGDEAKIYNEKIWNIVAKEIQTVVPGCVDRVLL